MKSITVNSFSKLVKYVEMLKAQKRSCIYEEFYNENGRFYVLFYK